MSRLTIKEENEYNFSPSNFNQYDQSNYYAELDEAIGKVLNKLGQLEDIEEELDIDFILVSKVLIALSKRCVFVKEMKLVHKEGYSYFEETGNIKRASIVHFSRFINGTEDWFFTTSFDNNSFTYLVKNYGKTWALTKEELL